MVTVKRRRNAVVSTPHAVIPTIGGNYTQHQMTKYYVYIICNKQKNVLYVGISNDWQRRINEHIADAVHKKQTFAGKYNCQYLLHLEEFMFVNDAIAREKERKAWNRMKKEKLITEHNPDWKFLNEQV